MAEQIGNHLPAPAQSEGAKYINDELLYSTEGYVQKGVTLKPGQGVLPLGTLLKQDGSTKQYVKATDNTATGVLRQSVDTDLDGKVWQANILYAGILRYTVVSSANPGVNLSSVLGATVNTVAGFFKF